MPSCQEEDNNDLSNLYSVHPALYCTNHSRRIYISDRVALFIFTGKRLGLLTTRQVKVDAQHPSQVEKEIPLPEAVLKPSTSSDEFNDLREA